MTADQASGGYFSREQPERVVASRTEVRTVPSALYPTIASAVPSAPGEHPILVRILPGVYYEALDISSPVVLVGAGKELPTIWGNRPEGVVISGGSSSCVLRHLRLCAEPKCHALSVRDSSPLIEDCELVGASGESARGAKAGLDVRGASQPVIRGCRISDHAGAGIAFAQAGGLVVACDIARCACGVWLEGGANPLIWRTTLASHRGAGVVVRADAAGCIAGNTILRNGAGGLLVESNRTSATTIVRNRVWANSGCDLRQSPAKNGGLSAGEALAVVLANTVGHFESPTASCGIELQAQWQEKLVSTWSELRRAVRDTPGERFMVLRVQGRIQVEEPLVLQRSVVLAGEPMDSTLKEGCPPGELCGPASLGALVSVESGDATVVFWRLNLTLSSRGSALAKTASCLEVVSGRPVLVDCDLKADDGTDANEASESASTAGLWAGADSNVLMFGCSVTAARGAGISLQGSACMVKCHVQRNLQGGIFVAEGGRLMAESCDINGNGHFSLVAGRGCRSILVGRTDLTGSDAGSLWHCGGESSSGPVLLDQCSVSGSLAPNGGQVASPAVLASAYAMLTLWDCFAPSIRKGTLAAVIRAEANSNAMVAGDGPTLGWPGWSTKSTKSAKTRTEYAGGASIGQGTVAWMDVSGRFAPPAGARSVMRAQRPSSASQSLQNWPAVNWNTSRGRTASTTSQLSDRDTEKMRASPPKEDLSAAQDSGDAEAAPQVEDTTAGEMPAEEPAQGPTGEAMETVEEEPEEDAAKENHVQWLRLRMENPATFGSEADRITLFELLQMLAVKDAHKEEVLDNIGLGGPIKHLDTVYLRGHTGLWMFVKNGTQLSCNSDDRTKSTAFVVEFKGGNTLKVDCRASFRVAEPGERPLWLTTTPSGDIGLIAKGDGMAEPATRFVVQSPTASAVLSGMFVHLKSMSTGKLMEVDGADVKARSSLQGTRQRIFVEKLPTATIAPEACGDLELSVEERAWIYLRASQASLVDRKNLAGFLSSPKPHCKELLKAYTRLWESEWRMEWRNTLEIPEESAASSPGSRQSSRSGSQGPTTTTPSDVSRRTRSQSRRRMSRTDWILGRLGGVSSTADDKSNGNLFVSAMRSFFANAIRMAKLEADPVQRVIEAFAEALVADSAFLSCFQASMLPEAERQTYRTPDEVLFGLAYTTLMLNTDMHNKQVAQKMWDNKKFVGAGKGCGVTGGLMAQIYKNIQGEEI